jgi:hypothetical protein
MASRTIDLRSLMIGLLAGTTLMLSMGQAPAPREAPAALRYEIDAVHDKDDGFKLFVFDHHTNKVYYRTLGSIQKDGIDVKWIIQNN